MSPQERKSASRQKDTIAVYQKLLAEEQEEDDNYDAFEKAPVGRPKTARRRAMELLAEQCGYSDWRSAQTVVRRWEATKKPMAFETYGMELSDEFAAMIRDLQDKAKRIEDAKGELESALLSAGGVASTLESLNGMEMENPTHLCPFCKACFEGCEYCEGDGWFERQPSVAVGKDKLLDTVDIHVEYKGKVIPIDELP